MKNVIAIAIVTLTLLLTVSAANASLMEYKGMGLNETLTLHATGLLGDNMTVYAGQDKFSYKGQDYTGYCVDLNQYAGSSNVTEKSTSDLPNGQIVAYLLSEFGGAHVTNGHQAAVLSVAIWELVSETSSTLDTRSGRFYVDNALVASDAMTLINSYNGQKVAPFLVLSSSSTQDFVVDGAQLLEVPEPATMALLGVGGMVTMIRRRKN